MKSIKIYTDGACSGNQTRENSGGWGAILEFQGHEKELSGGEDNTTNNKMELTALIEALSCLKEDGLDISIYSDSSYLINCFKAKWYEKWQINGWKTASKQPVENKELWEKLIALLSKHSCSFYLVKGHVNLNSESAMEIAYSNFVKNNGEIDFEEFRKIAEYNKRCDELATRFQNGIVDKD